MNCTEFHECFANGRKLWEKARAEGWVNTECNTLAEFAAMSNHTQECEECDRFIWELRRTSVDTDGIDLLCAKKAEEINSDPECQEILKGTRRRR